MKRRTIEASREIRHWITDVIFPTAAVLVVGMSVNPGMKAWASEKFNKAKAKFSKK